MLKKNSQWSIFIGFLLLINTIHAESRPKLILTPTSSPSIVASPGSLTKVLNYRVVNNSKRKLNLILNPIPGITQLERSDSTCGLPFFTLFPNDSCLMSVNIDYSYLEGTGIHQGPTVCKTKANNTNEPDPFYCSQPSAANALNITTSDLIFYHDNRAVSTINFTQGNSGSITLLNNGTTVATNLQITVPSVVSDYFISHCGATLNPKSSCTINYSIPSTAHTNATALLTATAANVNKSPIDLVVRVRAKGSASCWGKNDFDQLGRDTGGASSATPTIVQNLGSNVFEITGGRNHACALLTTGVVQCWGDNQYGQLGDASAGVKSSTPITIKGLKSTVVAISAGYYHTCALLDTGKLQCWGQNEKGQLGNSSNFGSTAPNYTPLDVENLNDDVMSISSGAIHTCVVLRSGGVKCWGYNLYQQLGQNTGGAASAIPLDVQNLSSNVAAVSSGSYFNCALLNTGAVKCWGNNSFKQLGQNTGGVSGTPLDVTNLNSGVLAITSGYGHNCALLDTNEIRCWGRNTLYELGVNGIASTEVPQSVTNINANVLGISTGLFHSCALLNTGDYQCWGDNSNSQLACPACGVKTFTPTSSIGSGVLAGLSTGLGYYNCTIV